MSDESPNNVVNLFAARKKKSATEAIAHWTKYYGGMDKLELLEQMVGYQARRAEAGFFPVEMLPEGIALFRALEQSAETDELRLLTRSYRRHLEYEMEHAV